MAYLMMGRSESSCSKCSKAVWPKTDHHQDFETMRYDLEQKKRVPFTSPGCGEKWEGIVLLYAMGKEDILAWAYKPNDWTLQQYPFLVGLPVFAWGDGPVCTFGGGLDIQLELPLDYST